MKGFSFTKVYLPVMETLGLEVGAAVTLGGDLSGGDTGPGGGAATTPGGEGTGGCWEAGPVWGTCWGGGGGSGGGEGDTEGFLAMKLE